MDRRALDIKVAAGRVRTDHTVEITRFEFVCVFCQSLEIADAVVTGTSLENVVEGQCAQGRVAARPAAAERHALAVDLSTRRQAPEAVDAVVDIANTPFTAQPSAVGPAAH